jgi:hypothetical protein
VLLVAGGGAAAILVTRHHAAPTVVPSASPASEAALFAVFTPPGKIGPFARSGDLSDESQANRIMQTLSHTGADVFAVPYDDTSDPSRILIVGGGDLVVANSAASMNSMLDALANIQPGAKFSDRRDASTGAVGGWAECETVTRTFGDVVVCGWFGPNTFITMVLVGSDRASAYALVPTVLEAVRA